MNSGLPAYEGYEFQMLATVWVALKLSIETYACDTLVVEPSSGEDIEAELLVDKETATGHLSLVHDQKSVSIQIKLRRTGHWTPSAFRNVLTAQTESPGARGPERRTRPLDLISGDADACFVLLTNAQVNRDLRSYVISDIGDNSKANVQAIKMDEPLDAAVAKRIGILEQFEQERLRLEIKDILRIHGHVPHAKCDRCIDLLKGCVRKRLLGRLPSAWSRHEIIAEIQKGGGSLRVDSEPLVKPSNFDEITDQLNERFKILLTGPPGIGKTFVAEHMANIHRLDDDPFEVITEEDGISTIRSCLAKKGKFLFFLNDPWGQYKLSQDADRWTSELPKLLESATTAKRFLITSRIGIKERALQLAEHSQLIRSEIQITEEHYSHEDRKEILGNCVRDPVPWQRDIIDQYESKIVGNLLAPFSIHIFANRLLNTKEEARFDIAESIRISNVDAIGSCLAQEVQSMGVDSIAAAAIIWALFMVSNTLTRNRARSARLAIRESGCTNIIDTEKMFDWLVGAKWIRPHRKGYIAHPTILDGLERLISSEPATTEEAIVALLRGLAPTENAGDALEIVKSLADRQLSIPAVVKQAINAYLLNQIKTATGYSYWQTARDVIEWSTSEDEVTQLIRILFDTKKIKGWGLEVWKKPVLDKRDLDRLSKSTDAHDCAMRFVNEALPEDHPREYKPEDMVSFFSTLGWDMSLHFISAAEKALERGSHSSEVLVEMALTCKNPQYERLMDSAFAAYDEVGEWWSEQQEQYRKAKQAEIDVNHAVHIEEEPGERILPAKGALEAIISMRSRAEGHHWIAEHPRSTDLMEHWGEVIDEATGEEEVEAIVEMCSQSERKIAWKAIRKAKCIKLAPVLVEALSNAPIEDVRYCTEALCAILSPDQWAGTVGATLQSLSYVRKASIWIKLHEIDTSRFKNAPDHLSSVESTLNQSELKCLQICKAIEKEETDLFLESIDNGAIEKLNDIAGGESEVLSVLAAWGLYRLEEPYEAYVQALIASKDGNIRQNALRLSATLETEPSKDILRRGLNDVEYRCRQASMWGLARVATKEDKKRIVAKVEDPSAPVRETCAEIIGAHEWTDEQQVLCRLLKDRRDASQDHLFRYHAPNHHVARAAALALLKLGKLSEEAIEKIIGILRNRNTKRDDVVLHYHLVDVIGQQDHQEATQMLLEYLDDPWHMQGVKLKGFPLRYAAAWSIFYRLIEDQPVDDSASIESLLKSANHPDGRLAGPCLICLGFLISQSETRVRLMLQHDTISRERALLMYSAAEAIPEGIELDMIDYIGSDHSGIRILSFLDQGEVPDEGEWERFLKGNHDIDQWIDSIQPFKDVNSALRLVFDHHLGNGIEPRFGCDDLRSSDLAKSIPVMTTRAMFGGE